MDRDPALTHSGAPQIALETLRRTFTASDPIRATQETLRSCARALAPAQLVVYRVDEDVDDPSVTFELDRQLTAGAPFDDELDEEIRRQLLARLELLSNGESAIFTLDNAEQQDTRYRSALAVAVVVEQRFEAVVVCASDVGQNDWTEESRALCDVAASAITLLTLRALAEQHDRLEATLKYSFDVIAVVGSDGTIISYTPNMSQVFGGSLDNLSTGDLNSPIHPQDRARVAQAFTEILGEPGGQRRIELRLRHSDGSWRQFEAVGTNQVDNPLIAGIVVTAHDVTDRKRLEDRLHWQALHDPLTKLANRALLLNDLRRALARSERSGEKIGILYLDLDGFKEINDHFGHSTGDQLLVRIGDRLRASVRSGETVARLGGDEFVILLEGLASLNDAERAASRILDAIRIPVPLSSGTVSITASLGIAIAANVAIDPEDLLAQADSALYAAKRAGRNQFQAHGLPASHDNLIA